MRTDILENLFLVEIRDIRSVKQQIRDALARVAKGVSAEGMGEALMKLLETVEHHVERLDRILKDARCTVPSIAEHVQGMLESNPLPRSFARLTSREAEVLQLIAEGHDKRRISGELGISVRSVEKHRQRLMAKLDLDDTDAAKQYAIAAGVVDPRE